MERRVTWLEHSYNRVKIALAIIAVGCAGGIWQGQVTVQHLRDEGKDRRNQSCLVLEKAEKKKIEGLVTLYQYIDKMPPEEVKLSLNQLLITRLPITEDEVREDSVPPYCDEPGIGLKEPNPKLPKKRDFSYLVIEPKSK